MEKVPDPPGDQVRVSPWEAARQLLGPFQRANNKPIRCGSSSLFQKASLSLSAVNQDDISPSPIQSSQGNGLALPFQNANQLPASQENRSASFFQNANQPVNQEIRSASSFQNASRSSGAQANFSSSPFQSANQPPVNQNNGLSLFQKANQSSLDEKNTSSSFFQKANKHSVNEDSGSSFFKKANQPSENHDGLTENLVKSEDSTATLGSFAGPTNSISQELSASQLNTSNSAESKNDFLPSEPKSSSAVPLTDSSTQSSQPRPASPVIARKKPSFGVARPKPSKISAAFNDASKKLLTKKPTQLLPQASAKSFIHTSSSLLKPTESTSTTQNEPAKSITPTKAPPSTPVEASSVAKVVPSKPSFTSSQPAKPNFGKTAKPSFGKKVKPKPVPAPVSLITTIKRERSPEANDLNSTSKQPQKPPPPKKPTLAKKPSVVNKSIHPAFSTSKLVKQEVADTPDNTEVPMDVVDSNNTTANTGSTAGSKQTKPVKTKLTTVKDKAGVDGKKQKTGEGNEKKKTGEGTAKKKTPPAGSTKSIKPVSGKSLVGSYSMSQGEWNDLFAQVICGSQTKDTQEVVNKEWNPSSIQTSIMEDTTVDTPKENGLVCPQNTPAISLSPSNDELSRDATNLSRAAATLNQISCNASNLSEAATNLSEMSCDASNLSQSVTAALNEVPRDTENTDFIGDSSKFLSFTCSPNPSCVSSFSPRIGSLEAMISKALKSVEDSLDGSASLSTSTPEGPGHESPARDKSKDVMKQTTPLQSPKFPNKRKQLTPLHRDNRTDAVKKTKVQTKDKVKDSRRMRACRQENKENVQGGLRGVVRERKGKEMTHGRMRKASIIAQNNTHLSPNSAFVKQHVLASLDQLDEEVWVQCETCSKWRRLPMHVDPLTLPEKWTCNLHPDKSVNNCDAAEEAWEEKEETFVYEQYVVGSVVWARIQHTPWWPAMVDVDPDYGRYVWFDSKTLPTKYHVTFFGDPVTRAWVTLNNMTMFRPSHTHRKFNDEALKDIVLVYSLRFAVNEAREAYNMKVQQRRKKFAFVSRYCGKLGVLRSNLTNTNTTTDKQCSSLAPTRSPSWKPSFKARVERKSQIQTNDAKSDASSKGIDKETDPRKGINKDSDLRNDKRKKETDQDKNEKETYSSKDISHKDSDSSSERASSSSSNPSSGDDISSSEEDLETEPTKISAKNTESGSSGHSTTENGVSKKNSSTENGASGIKNSTENGTSGIKNSTENGTSGIKNSTENGASGIKNSIENGTSGIKNSTENGNSGIKNSTENGTSGIKNSTENGTSGIKNSTENGTSGIKNSTENGASGIKNSIENGGSDGDPEKKKITENGSHEDNLHTHNETPVNNRSVINGDSVNDSNSLDGVAKNTELNTLDAVEATNKHGASTVSNLNGVYDLDNHSPDRPNNSPNSIQPVEKHTKGCVDQSNDKRETNVQNDEATAQSRKGTEVNKNITDKDATAMNKELKETSIMFKRDQNDSVSDTNGIDQIRVASDNDEITKESGQDGKEMEERGKEGKYSDRMMNNEGGEESCDMKDAMNDEDETDIDRESDKEEDNESDEEDNEDTKEDSSTETKTGKNSQDMNEDSQEGDSEKENDCKKAIENYKDKADVASEDDETDMSKAEESDDDNDDKAGESDANEKKEIVGDENEESNDENEESNDENEESNDGNEETDDDNDDDKVEGRDEESDGIKKKEIVSDDKKEESNDGNEETDDENDDKVEGSDGIKKKEIVSDDEKEESDEENEETNDGKEESDEEKIEGRDEQADDSDSNEKKNIVGDENEESDDDDDDEGAESDEDDGKAEESDNGSDENTDK